SNRRDNALFKLRAALSMFMIAEVTSSTSGAAFSKRRQSRYLSTTSRSSDRSCSLNSWLYTRSMRRQPSSDGAKLGAVPATNADPIRALLLLRSVGRRIHQIRSDRWRRRSLPLLTCEIPNRSPTPDLHLQCAGLRVCARYLTFPPSGLTAEFRPFSVIQRLQRE